MSAKMSGKGEKKRRRALDAYMHLQRAAALSAARVDLAVQPYSLSASQFGVLDTIDTRGAVHQQELAEALDRSKAQMTAIIDALESRGLVRRERHAVDRRFITVHLTPMGSTVLAEARPARLEVIGELMSELSGDQRVRLARLCRRLIRVLDPFEDPEEAGAGVAEDEIAAEVTPENVGRSAPEGDAPDDLTSGRGATNGDALAAPDFSRSSASHDAGTAFSSDSRADTGT